MTRKRWIVLCLWPLLLWIAFPAFASEEIKLPCEVMEASPAFKGSSGLLSGVRYLLVHQANSADREKFSKWLKGHSGTEVKFVVEHREYRGILCRLANCFGRGLLIYQSEITTKKRDIIDLFLPVTPQCIYSGDHQALFIQRVKLSSAFSKNSVPLRTL